MSKSPEEYFQEQDFSLSADKDSQGFSSAEEAFIEKYMGLEAGAALASLPQSADLPRERMADLHEEMNACEDVSDVIKKLSELQMVAFFLGSQEFTLPTIVVQEVIRAVPVVRLPTASGMVAGVISLRGKVTPLLHLRDILEVNSPRLNEDKFIIVCRRQGIQIGLIIERIHTMYLRPQSEIDWAVESSLGSSCEFISGLVKINELLVGIVDVDKIIKTLLA
jgi:Chemotaxis signal transduction protein